MVALILVGFFTLIIYAVVRFNGAQYSMILVVICMSMIAMRHFDNALRVNPANELALFSAGIYAIILSIADQLHSSTCTFLTVIDSLHATGHLYGRNGRAADAHSAIEVTHARPTPLCGGRSFMRCVFDLHL
jgi:hypothetical protein